MSIGCVQDIKYAYYINLEYRTDRKYHIEQELEKMGIKAERFNAIKMNNGAIGCSMSHLKVLQNAEKNKLSHVLVLEDDIRFVDPLVFKRSFKKCMTKLPKWDVILFAGNNLPPYVPIGDYCIKVGTCQTTTGYLVNGHYISTLIENIKTGISYLLKYPNNKTFFAIDRFWFHLQQRDNWFLVVPPVVTQRVDYSDIEGDITDYDHLMFDLDKVELMKMQDEMMAKQLENLSQINFNSGSGSSIINNNINSIINKNKISYGSNNL